MNKSITSTILIKTLIIFISVSFISCTSSHKSIKEPKANKWKYFKILADADDDPIFVKLQDDLGIDPKMERYSIIVDIRAKDQSLQYVSIGDEYNSRRYQWTQLSEQVRNGLINWTGSSKENLE
jgi:hypothetical protein